MHDREAGCGGARRVRAGAGPRCGLGSQPMTDSQQGMGSQPMSVGGGSQDPCFPMSLSSPTFGWETEVLADSDA